MESSTVSSVLETSLFEECLSCGVTWPYYATLDWSVLAAEGGRPRGKEATLEVLVVTVVPGADEEVLEEDKEMTLWSIVTIAKS